MNKVLLFFMLGLFMISFTTALEFDNVKSYDRDSRTITIDNGFGLLGEIADIQLKSDLVEVVPIGYQKVAEFEVTMNRDYTTSFKEMEFYDKRKDNERFTRDFDYKYLVQETTTVQDYETVCSNNKTCESVNIGSHEVTRDVWYNLDSSNFEDGQILTIAIFTDVQKGDHVEWIPNFFGVRIDEWAVWTASLNVDLLTWYKLDQSTGVVLDSVLTGVFNATNVGSARGVTGIINNSFNLTRASGDHIFIDSNFGITNYPFSISGWFNTNFSGAEMSLFGMSSRTTGLSNGINYVVNVNGADNLFILARDDTTTDTTGTSETINDGVWHNVIVVFHNATSRQLYLDGASILNQTTSVTYNNNNMQFLIGAQNATIGNFFDGGIDEVGFWERSLNLAEVVQLYNGGAGITILEVPNVTLNTPLDSASISTSNVTFNATVGLTGLGEFTITNVSLFIDSILNETNSSGVVGDYIFEKNLSDATHTWLVAATNSDGLTTNSTQRTFDIITSAPTINVTAPIGIIDFGKVGENQSVEWNITTAAADTCIIEYNGINSTEICNNNQSNITLVAGVLNLTFYANDTSGNQGLEFITWSYHIFENNQTFSVNTTEGSTENFTLNYQANETPISASFIYNQTITSADIDDSNFPIVVLTESIVIPAVTELTVIPFKWNVVTASSNVNTTTTNQTISDLTLDNCSVFTNVLFNLTVVDEATQVILNGSGDNVSVEVDISIFSADRGILVLNFSTEYNQTNPNSVCSESSLFNGTNYILDAIFKYSSAARAIEYYNIRDTTIDNSSTVQNITLFDIKTDESTEFQITFKNSDFVIVENALIQVNRQYVSEGVFKTVELPITDSNGQTVVHLVANDIVYNYIVTKNNVVLGTFDNLIAFCDDASIGQCFISLNALSGTVPAFNPDTGSGISITPLVFNSTSRDLTFMFTTNDGSVRTVVMNGTKMDQLGNTTVCLSTLTSSSGTLTCNVPVSLGNETIIIDIFVDDELSFTSFFRAANDIELGDSGFFLLLFLVISLGLMFAESKSMIIIGIIIGFISGSMLFFIQGGIIGGGSAIMWLIVMGIILIWKLNQEGQT